MGGLDGDAEMLLIEVGTDAGGASLLTVSGQLDISNADQLEQAVERATARTRDGLVFDLSSLEFMDSAGISVIVRAASELDSVSLRNPSPMVRRLIEITGLSEILVIEP